MPDSVAGSDPLAIASATSGSLGAGGSVTETDSAAAGSIATGGAPAGESGVGTAGGVAIGTGGPAEIGELASAGAAGCTRWSGL